MKSESIVGLARLMVLLLFFQITFLYGEEPVPADKADKAHDSSTHPRVTAASARLTIDRGLAFLSNDLVKWRAERGCVTCHHGTMTVWALNEARAQGYSVDAERLAEVTKWTKDHFIARIVKPRDPRPGWNLVSISGIYLGIMSRNLPVLSRTEIHEIASHLARHQEEDGSWLSPPAENGAPPTWESPETVAQLALLAWEQTVPTNSAAAAAIAANREKAVDWLRKTTPSQTTQAISLRLLLDREAGQSKDDPRPRIDQLLAAQNPNGGWGQTKDLDSDAYATGQALYALSFAGVGSDEHQVRRAVEFLVVTQKEDGSWPMTSRNHPGVESTRDPLRNPIPITYFGTAWAVLGLVRNVPVAADAPPKQ